MPIDHKKYPANWKDISERIRFVRAQNRCEGCGAPNYDPHPETGSKVVLTVAHLNHNPMDSREENLKALCQRCHFRHDRQRNIKLRKERREAKKS